MASTEARLRYAIDNDDAKIDKIKIGNRKGLQNVVIIGERQYQYNPNKISKLLTTKLKQLTKTPQFNATQQIKTVYQGIRLRKSLTAYAVKYKANVSDATSAFSSYTNAYSISNIKLKGLKGLSYLKYQYDKLNNYFMSNPGMKILIHVYVDLLEHGDTEPSVTRIVQSRRYDINNTDDLKDALNKMAGDIELEIEIKQFHKSNLRVHGINKIVIQYDRYNPTRGGSYIKLPEWIANKKACVNIKNEDNKCLKYSIQCGIYKIYDNLHPEKECHYKKLKDTVINWDLMKYPAGNRDIDRLEANNDGVLSVNVYQEYNHYGKSTIVLHRRTKVVNATHHVNLLKIDDDSGKFHYVYVKNYNKLVGSQTNKGTNKLFHCRYCQHGFKREDLLQEHLTRGCLAVEGQSVKMPDEGARI